VLPKPSRVPLLEGMHYRRTRILPDTSGLRLQAILIAGMGAFSACGAGAIILRDVASFAAGFVCGILYLGMIVMVGQRLRDVQPIA
jgi:hypothetical protein